VCRPTWVSETPCMARCPRFGARRSSSALLLLIASLTMAQTANSAICRPLHPIHHRNVTRSLLLSKSTAVAPPAAPGSYPLPAGATVVSSSAQLVSALSSATRNIVLADGTYDSAVPFSDPNGSNLYAQHLGAAVLSAGLVVGGNFGAGGTIIRGLAFNISDPRKTFQGGEIDIWGTGGANTQVLDSTFEGHGVVPVGLLALNPDGLVAQRLTLSHFTDEGIRASDNNTTTYGSPTAVINSISDISIDGVSYATPGASNGTAEAGLWIGQPVKNGVHRIRIRNVSFSGVELVDNSWDTTFTDLDIDMSGPNQAAGVGIYLEHYALHDTFTNFQITGANTGINAEWDNSIAGKAAAHDTTIQNGTIDANGATGSGHHAGVFLDEGTDSTTIANVTFRNQNWAAIADYKNVGNNTVVNNDLGLAGISTSHI
jgi:hypothetical protein